MALGPQPQKRLDLVTKAEAIIDDTIRQSDNGSRVMVKIELLPGLDSEGMRLLCANYRKAGWMAAEFITDRSEYDYFQLLADLQA